jgi:selenide,water dikinase
MAIGGHVALTEMARGAGCGCKLAPGLLAQALGTLPAPPADPDILVGNGSLDDAAVYRLSDERAVVATVDFFTPVVDDPAVFGAIAATNAISDLYAMGATPLMALAVAAFPKEAPPEWLAEVLRGGAETALAHGCPVLGGHTIDDPEPKYGLCAIGLAHPDRLMTNDAGRAGDVLILTKPLGVGVAVRAARSGEPAALDAAIAAMLASNGPGSAAALRHGVRAATDVTGFGLLGHLRELAAASGTSAELDAGALPLLPGALELAEAGHETGGAGRNRAFVGPFADVDPAVPAALLALLFDPQTSGGLLLAVPPDRLDGLRADLPGAAVIGRLADGPAGRIRVGVRAA